MSLDGDEYEYAQRRRRLARSNAVQYRWLMATQPRITRWNLYIDESGDFSDPGEQVVVGGMLVRADASGFDEMRLKRALEEALPAIDWPPHTRYYDREAAHVMFAVRRAAAVPMGRHETDTVGLLKKVAPGAWRRALARSANAMEPAYEDVRLLSQTIRGDRSLARYWRGVVRERHASIRGILDSARASTPEAPAVLVLTDETRLGEAAGTTDRYLSLLGVAIERAAEVIAALGGRHKLRLYVLSRGVRVEGCARSVGLTSEIVVDAVARVVGRDERGRVRFTHAEAVVDIACSEVRAWNADTPASLALADWLVYRGRHGVAPRRPLAATQQSLGDQCGLSACHAGLPTLAAYGDARERVAAARERPAQPPPTLSGPPPRRRWVAEQAERWVSHYARPEDDDGE